MAADELPEDQRLHNISPKAYEHPADRAATAALQQIPMIDTVVRKLIEFGERSVFQELMASAVRLGEDQMPEVYASHRASLARLDIEYVPDLYIVQWPFINAMAIGSKKPIVVVNSGTVNLMDEHELRTVLAHEAGHILSDHVMYQTALFILLRMGSGALNRLPFFAGLPLLAIRLALLEWFRAAELTCDRAATIVTRSPMTTCQTMMVMAAGASSRKLSLDAFVAQANEYVDWEPGWDKLMRFGRELNQTHPYPVRRVHELMKWVRSGEYDRIINGEYVKRGTKADAREAAADATDYYADKFKGIFEEAGVGVRKAGDKAGEAADRISDWLKQR
ncbi:Zn-dependent protease with chaperone function [Solirubrobacter pauli]|uniref:Zn-dependent protease with chaperone function n=1 Tax=Solirubrobacter pauli TaxID=166793 RepID=A0A660L1V1_9ACTN|nr:M48 family metallopeptidase [Solirubrobacter pauli]RKQ87285.1 Zn-dependent protease with chaperone function [Solirubrobacter pauli]